MINTKKVLLVVFSILIPLATIVSIVYLYQRKLEDVKGVDSTIIEKCTPYVTNMMPNVAYVGKEYYFLPKIVGCDIETIQLEVNGASWLSVGEGRYVSGIPSLGDIGTYKVTLSVSGILGSSQISEYIVVEEYEK